MKRLIYLVAIILITIHFSAGAENLERKEDAIYSSWGYVWLDQDLLVLITQFSNPDELFQKSFNLKNKENLYRITIYDYKPRNGEYKHRKQRQSDIINHFEIDHDISWNPIKLTTKGYEFIDNIKIKSLTSQFVKSPDTFVFLLVGSNNLFKVSFGDRDYKILKSDMNPKSFDLIKRRLLEREEITEYFPQKEE